MVKSSSKAKTSAKASKGKSKMAAKGKSNTAAKGKSKTAAKQSGKGSKSSTKKRNAPRGADAAKEILETAGAVRGSGVPMTREDAQHFLDHIKERDIQYQRAVAYKSKKATATQKVQICAYFDENDELVLAVERRLKKKIRDADDADSDADAATSDDAKKPAKKSSKAGAKQAGAKAAGAKTGAKKASAKASARKASAKAGAKSSKKAGSQKSKTAAGGRSKSKKKSK